MQRNSMTLAFALLVVSSYGCTEPLLTPDFASAPASITVDVNPSSLVVGQTVTVAATVMDASGHLVSGKPISWSSADPTVASISSDGVINALSSGTAEIKAAVGDVVGQKTIAVVASSGGPAAPTPPPSTAPSSAELPRVMLETSAPVAPAAGGTVISVDANGDLQAAINQANPGDVIELAAGAVYTGNFVLPNKGSGTAWIVIRPAAAASVLPTEGRRMTPALAALAKLPSIQTPNNASAIQTAPGAHHYRLVGLDVTTGPSNTTVNTLISLGTDASGGQTNLAVVPHDIVLDRMYIHGNPTVTLRRGVALNSASSAVIDSYISDVHEQGGDSQTIMGWNGPGPYKIVNNYLEAAGEIVMFGGGSPSIPNLVPSDIEVRHNYLSRPVSWKGSAWSIKNLFELKNASRVLVEGNVMENNWIAAQDGTAIVLKSTDQDGTAPWSGTSNVTFRLNIVRNVGAGFNIAAHPETYPVDPLHSVAVTDNIVSNINVGQFNGAGRAILVQGNITDVSIAHNTIYNETQPFAALVFGPVGAITVRFSFANNITASATNWGVFGDNVAPGVQTMTTYAPDGSLSNNVFAGNAGNGYPAGNFFVPAVTGVGFANPAGGDFSLTSTSPFKGAARDGKDPGADVGAVLAATNGVVLP